MALPFGTSHQKGTVLSYFNSVKIRLTFLLTGNVESTPINFMHIQALW